MNRRSIVLEYRTKRMLKGLRPAVVFLKRNIGKIYLEGEANFIMTITPEELYFQRLSLFTKKLLPEKDFSIKISQLREYVRQTENYVTESVTLYTKDRLFLKIYYNSKTMDTYETEQNINEIIEKLKQKGIQEGKL